MENEISTQRKKKASKIVEKLRRRHDLGQHGADWTKLVSI
jgi:hypothetical protein